MAQLPDDPRMIEAFWEGCGYSPEQVAAGTAPDLGKKLCEFMGLDAPYNLSRGATAFAGMLATEGIAA
jgi:hypothetical protein